MSDRNERLRERLRRGDPADGGLSSEEVQAMRRAVLNAAPEPRRRVWLVPVLATAASLMLAVALSLSLGRHPLPRAGTEKTPSPTFPRSAGEGATAPSSEEREGTVVVARYKRSSTISKPKHPPVIPSIPEEPRQIQFSTPGGTRVIWTLNPATE